MNLMAAFYYGYPHKRLARKHAAAMEELAEMGDAIQQHLIADERWATKEAALLARIGDLTSDLTESIEREASPRVEDPISRMVRERAWENPS